MAAQRLEPTDSITVLGFSARVRNGLHRGDIATVGDLLAHSGGELLDIPSFGTTMLDEVVAKLAEHGLELKPSAYLPPRPRVRPGDEKTVREQVAKELLAVDPAEWALAGQHAGSMAARIARGER